MRRSTGMLQYVSTIAGKPTKHVGMPAKTPGSNAIKAVAPPWLRVIISFSQSLSLDSQRL
ncbi:MAG: hypothetical protein QOF72_3052 [Blastocatellia bacterium]|jgi:hypothetical protein|nr:hypothetical protein [Blastocatellia bacterium]